MQPSVRVITGVLGNVARALVLGGIPRVECANVPDPRRFTIVAIAVARLRAALVERFFRGDGRALWAEAAVPGLQKRMRVELEVQTFWNLRT